MKNPEIKVTDYRREYRFRRDYPQFKERLQRVHNRSIKYALDMIGLTKAQEN